MTRDYYQKMHQYDYWANQEVLQSLAAVEAPPEKAVSLMAHIIAAQQIWHARVNERDSSGFSVWPDFDIGVLPGINGRNT